MWVAAGSGRRKDLARRQVHVDHLARDVVRGWF